MKEYGNAIKQLEPELINITVTVASFLVLVLFKMFNIYISFVHGEVDLSNDSDRSRFIQLTEQALHQLFEEFLVTYRENRTHVSTNQDKNQMVKYWSSKGISALVGFIKTHLSRHDNCNEDQINFLAKASTESLLDGLKAFKLAFELAG